MERLAFTGSLPPPTTTVSRPGIRDSASSVADPSEEGIGTHDLLAYKSLLAFIFVLFVRPQDQLPFLEFLHLAEVTGIFALVALIGGRLSRNVPISQMTLELVAVLAFGGVMLATAPFAFWPGGAVGVFTDLFSKVIVVFALMLNTVTTRARFERFVSVVVIGTSYVAARTVIDYLRGVNLVEGGRAGGAVGGLFGNPNDMALNMVAFLPLAIVIALSRGRPLLRSIAIAGIPAIAAAIVFSKSRGGALGLVAMLAVLLYQLRRIRPAIGVLVIAAACVTVPMLPASFTARMSSILNPAEDPTGSREARKRLMRDGYQAFLDNPIVGLGAGQFQNYNPTGPIGRKEEAWRETHNAVLQVASELGAGGLIIFIVIVSSGFSAALRTGAALRRSRPSRRAHPPGDDRHREPLQLYAAALIASLTGWLVAAMFASVAYYWTLYLVLGLATALRNIATGDARFASRSRRTVTSVPAPAA
jgi:O-antigen ligase